MITLLMKTDIPSEFKSEWQAVLIRSWKLAYFGATGVRLRSQVSSSPIQCLSLMLEEASKTLASEDAGEWHTYSHFFSETIRSHICSFIREFPTIELAIAPPGDKRQPP